MARILISAARTGDGMTTNGNSSTGEFDSLAALRSRLEIELAGQAGWAEFLATGVVSDVLSSHPSFQAWRHVSGAMAALTGASVADEARRRRARRASLQSQAAGVTIREAAVAVLAPGNGPEAAQRADRAPDASTQPGLDGDDLTKVRGITRALAGRLNEIGIKSYEQIAGWDSATIDQVAARLDLGRRIVRESWVAQAELLVQDAAARSTVDQSGADQPTNHSIDADVDAQAQSQARDPQTGPAAGGQGHQDEVVGTAQQAGDEAHHEGEGDGDGEIVAGDDASPDTPLQSVGDPANDNRAGAGSNTATGTGSFTARSLLQGTADVAIIAATPVPDPTARMPATSDQNASEHAEQPQPDDTTARISPDPTSPEQPARQVRVLPRPLPRPLRRRSLLQELEGTEADPVSDLLDIRGITPELKRRLRGHGIVTVDDVARLRAADVHRLEAQLGPAARIAKDNWIEQATVLAAGGETAFKRLRAQGVVDALVSPPRSNLPWLPRLRITELRTLVEGAATLSAKTGETDEPEPAGKPDAAKAPDFAAVRPGHPSPDTSRGPVRGPTRGSSLAAQIEAAARSAENELRAGGDRLSDSLAARIRRLQAEVDAARLDGDDAYGAVPEASTADAKPPEPSPRKSEPPLAVLEWARKAASPVSGAAELELRNPHDVAGAGNTAEVLPEAPIAVFDDAGADTVDDTVVRIVQRRPEPGHAPAPLPPTPTPAATSDQPRRHTHAVEQTGQVGRSGQAADTNEIAAQQTAPADVLDFARSGQTLLDVDLEASVEIRPASRSRGAAPSEDQSVDTSANASGEDEVAGQSGKAALPARYVLENEPGLEPGAVARRLRGQRPQDGVEPGNETTRYIAQPQEASVQIITPGDRKRPPQALDAEADEADGENENSRTFLKALTGD